ncbi:MAG TPA: Zn-ribbon domain-containing OB-fold protein [Syntrophales bacterium]|nr:Zn-ribbon domain-containing OB-fold protein [Syntrophales bacterium]HOM07560.1 Zn-ribbon domain-containing OB-fold protein [Syntrophales bacterium]HOO00088.1 Zn-ribbon domain-containing OB-fold protein [Syntrophales bacterium]
MTARETEWISIPMTVDVPYRFAAGRYLTKTLTQLRDNGRIFAVECPRCRRIQLPPRIVCAQCHVRNGRWVELPLEGTLVAFTIMFLPLTDPTTGKPHEPPFVYGSVRLDGCDSVLDHLIHAEPDRGKVWVGMRCRVVLRPPGERVGDLSDIVHFEPLPDQSRPGS